MKNDSQNGSWGRRRSRKILEGVVKISWGFNHIAGVRETECFAVIRTSFIYPSRCELSVDSALHIASLFSVFALRTRIVRARGSCSFVASSDLTR